MKAYFENGENTNQGGDVYTLHCFLKFESEF